MLDLIRVLLIGGGAVAIVVSILGIGGGGTKFKSDIKKEGDS